jgi:ketosteroid isomerase-like protein
MKKAVIFLIVAVILGSCTGTGERVRERAKHEILAMEKEFQQMVREKGVKEAFLFFADENATLIRGGKLITGKNKIREWFDKTSGVKLELFWKPDFVEASVSGDMGYTYGQYSYIITDTAGIRKEGTGVFHTIWKRQPDGSWKYVWD